MVALDVSAFSLKRATGYLLEQLATRDGVTAAHSMHVAVVASNLAREMGLRSEVVWLYEAGLLHDIGKLYMPEHLLVSRKVFTPEERRLMQSHVTYTQIVLRHHGYSYSLKEGCGLDILVPVGMLLGFSCLLVAFILEGGHLSSLVGVSPFLIVFGGTIGATLIGLGMEEVRSLPGLLKAVMANRKYDLEETIESLAELAVVARREGFPGLERQLEGISEPFLRTALQLVVDGTDPEYTRAILEQYIYTTAERHAKGIKIFEAAGGYAPTMGIIGTVMGLIHVLSNISTPDKLGPSIALAFIATLYGVSTANLIWLPIAAKLKAKSDKERLYQELVMEGVLAIQAGKSPMALRTALLAFLSPGKQHKVRERPVKEGQISEV